MKNNSRLIGTDAKAALMKNMPKPQNKWFDYFACWAYESDGYGILIMTTKFIGQPNSCYDTFYQFLLKPGAEVNGYVGAGDYTAFLHKDGEKIMFWIEDCETGNVIKKKAYNIAFILATMGIDIKPK